MRALDAPETTVCGLAPLTGIAALVNTRLVHVGVAAGPHSLNTTFPVNVPKPVTVAESLAVPPRVAVLAVETMVEVAGFTVTRLVPVPLAVSPQSGHGGVKTGVSAVTRPCTPTLCPVWIPANPLTSTVGTWFTATVKSTVHVFPIFRLMGLAGVKLNSPAVAVELMVKVTPAQAEPVRPVPVAEGVKTVVAWKFPADVPQIPNGTLLQESCAWIEPGGVVVVLTVSVTPVTPPARGPESFEKESAAASAVSPTFTGPAIAIPADIAIVEPDWAWPSDGNNAAIIAHPASASAQRAPMERSQTVEPFRNFLSHMC